ncbi:MAG: DUF4124 domain-containing protein [Gammaproteobacteria bacterium]|nr:DUF4124 domain-containing protein [Gammaproteobacteria bacterium]
MSRQSARGAPLAALLTVWLAGALTPPAGADALYRWIDADGRVHFSDRPPMPGAPASVERLPTPRYADPGIPSGHYSVTEQLQRLQAERLAREQQRRERQREAREQALREREVAAAERAAEQAAAAPALRTPVWVTPRLRPPTYRHGHHPRGPAPATPYTGLWKPDHPAYRPPQRRPKPASAMRDGR